MTRPKHISFLGLVTPDEQTQEWMAAARTSETRGRIRRWSKAETVAVLMMLAGVALLILAMFASVAVAIWSSVTDAGHAGFYWWIWGVAIGVTVLGAVGSLIATKKRQTACFADGRVAEGTVERAIEHPGSGDDQTWFDLRISAELPDGTTLRRRLHVQGDGFEQRAGRPVRFRHNTLDPDDLDDLLLDGWPERRKDS